MKTYRVVTRETLETTWLVEAASEDDAEVLAMHGSGEQLACDTSDLEIIDVAVDEEE